MGDDDEIRRRWNTSEDAHEARAEAARMWPERLGLGRWDGVQIDQERALLIQRQAYEMGARDQYERTIRRALDGGAA